METHAENEEDLVSAPEISSQKGEKEAEKKENLVNATETSSQRSEKEAEKIEDINEYLDEVLDFENQLKKLPNDLKKAKESASKSIIVFEDLNARLKARTNYNEKLKGENEKKEVRLNLLKAELKEIKPEIDRLEEKNRKLNDLKGKVVVLEPKNEEANLEIEVLEQDVVELKEEISIMQDYFTAAPVELDRLSKVLLELENDVEMLSGELINLDSVETKKDELVKLGVENVEIAEDIKRRKKELRCTTELNEKLFLDEQNKKDELMCLESNVEELRNRVKPLRSVVISNDDIDGLQADADSLMDEIKRVHVRSKIVELELGGRLVDKEIAVKEIDSLKAELESMGEKYLKARDIIDSGVVMIQER